jgi:hypothetical protein
MCMHLHYPLYVNKWMCMHLHCPLYSEQMTVYAFALPFIQWTNACVCICTTLYTWTNACVCICTALYTVNKCMCTHLHYPLYSEQMRAYVFALPNSILTLITFISAQLCFNGEIKMISTPSSSSYTRIWVHWPVPGQLIKSTCHVSPF